MSKIILGNENNSNKVIIGLDGQVLAGKVEEYVKKVEQITDVVTVAELALELGILPKSLRSRLRKSGYKKVGSNWEWKKDSTELKEIRDKFKSK